MALILWVFSLLDLSCLVSANIFEYQVDAQPFRPCELQREEAFLKQADYVPQCAEDGSFQSVQCENRGRSCWCVDAEGREVAGSRQSGRPSACLSFCQLHRQQILLSGYINSTATSYLPRCQDSGDYAPVQCDLWQHQCWCVDTEGMEVYGTRQLGRPSWCPRGCEIRSRRLLHGVGDKSPPQCSPDGDFMPVQCKFVNTTDMMVFDLVHSYNRFPDAFVTFSSFRSRFPEVSGYCHCADSQGRELAETGLEMLLDEIYDTVFAGLNLTSTFNETTLYRILQRRFLAIQFVISGRFRCPTKCEVEQFTATNFRHPYIPSCLQNGDYQVVQCQSDGPCWCVDTQGKEIHGTQRQGEPPYCAEGQSCTSERRQALSRLHFGPSGYFSQHNLFLALRERKVSPRVPRSATFCSPLIKELFVDSGILHPVTEEQDGQFTTSESFLKEAIRMIFPSKELARLALRFTTNPKRLQQNLFGGNFLVNVGQFNLSGALGTRSTFNFSYFFQQLGLPDFQNRGVPVTDFFVELDSDTDTEKPKVFKKGITLNKTIVGSFGFKINFQENQKALKFLVSLLEFPQFLLFLQHAISVPEDIAKDLGDVMEMVLTSQDCEQTPDSLFVPSCTGEGSYEQVQCFAGECWCVDSLGKELPGTRVRGQHPRCPTECEKQRLSMQSLSSSQPAGASLFVPSCTSEGHFLPVQCFNSECYCVDTEGHPIPGTQSGIGEPKQCPTPCQLQAEQAFLGTMHALVSNSSTPSMLFRIYIPQCSASGQWRQVQCDGLPEQAFQWYQRWKTQNSDDQEMTPDDLLVKIMNYREAASRSFRLFIQNLFEAGQQGIFPGLARYSSFQDVPLAVLEGNLTYTGENIFLEPYFFWQMLNGQLSHYPGPYSDFSMPLAHFDLRSCWCVDKDGQELQGTKTEPNKFPACPGSCGQVKLRVLQFIKETEEIVLASNSFQFPLGESFLAAKGIQLTSEELALTQLSPSWETFLERFLSGNNYAIRLAAQSTFNFYQRRNSIVLGNSTGATAPLLSGPYVPQCDTFGNWVPLQCYAQTGHCWCVDGKGDYLPASLTVRSSEAPQCPSPCEKSRVNGLLSSWKQAVSQGNLTTKDLFIPVCLQTGEYARLQMSEAGMWCMDPASGEAVLSGMNNSTQCPICEALQGRILSRRTNLGSTPTCRKEDGTFSPVQCDPSQDSCWCVLSSGEEVPDTRVTGSQPFCDSPKCPLPFNTSDVTGGVILCEPASVSEVTGIQKCQLMCRQDFRNVFPTGPLECNLQGRRWVSQPPQPQACQRPQLWQTMQTRVQFRLQLPLGKMCSEDYAGLLQAFQVFILDELSARGFCQLQVMTLGTYISIPICDDSTVKVVCLTGESLGVNVTWKLWIKDVPAVSLPDMHDIEKALTGKDLVGSFVDLIQSGAFQLYLDSKTFPADTSIRFFQGDSLVTSPRTWFGCLEGFYQIMAASSFIQDPWRCVKCPEGSFLQNEQCVPCPVGFYQEQAGSLACAPCPVGRTTASVGAFSQTHCITDCEMNEIDLQCDQNGQYRASQRDRANGKNFCVDYKGQKLLWSETETLLTDSQCLMMQKFEKFPESKVIFNAEISTLVRSKIPGSKDPFMQCLADCAMDETCSFFTMFKEESEVVCDFYAFARDNIACMTSTQDQNASGDSKLITFESLRCQLKVRRGNQDSVAVYLKKGQEFTTTGQKSFEQTGFQNTFSGVYSPVVFSALGASLTEAHLFCLLACDHDSCCDGFLLAQIQGGLTFCGLLSSPDILLCHMEDWRDPSEDQANTTCLGVTYDRWSRQVTLRLGGQEFKDLTLSEGTQSADTSFQQVYLWKDSDMGSRSESMECRGEMASRPEFPTEADAKTELFSPVDINQITIDGNQSLPSQQHWLFKYLFSSQQAHLWCLSRCVQEASFCQLAEITDSEPLYFTCTLYPEAQVCDHVLESNPKGCRLILPHKPEVLFRKKVTLKGKVKNFYTRLPFQKLTEISIRSKVLMSDKSISDGFFECEQLCDLDLCCTGFGFLNVSQLKGGEVICLTLNSLGLQTCSEENEGAWHIWDCDSPDVEVRTYPFGWYQKPVTQNGVPSFCPSVLLPSLMKNVSLDSWQSLAPSSVIIDTSIRNFDVAHISSATISDFSDAQNFCLLECSRHQACFITTLQTQPGAVRCVFYPDTQTCTHSLQTQNCQLLLREEANYIFRKPNTPLPGFGTSTPFVSITNHGELLGRSQAIQIGTSWKQVDQFLGVPYATPPVEERRFQAPEPLNWKGSWDATKPRPSCWQPGARTPIAPGVSEDCLYLNVFVPQNVAPNSSVLVFFHNTMEGRGSGRQLVLDGSFLAAVGNLIVVTASYRVGVFGFLSSGSGELSGNWGLLDQAAALTWVQTNIGVFGGDSQRVSLGADRGGADVASMHLLTIRTSSSRLFQRAVLMGGSALSPAAVISQERAQQQANALAKEVGCPSSSTQEMVSCLHQMPASILNDAQTKLLAVSGPFHYWGPVVDGQYLREAPANALQRSPRPKVDLLIGSSQDDGLINRAKAVKQFEESQGRTSSKAAFYQALQNSLGGEKADTEVLAAATWYYSLEHSTDDYASFSRALENATRDYFITCPVIDMASHWARRTRGNVFMYYAPESYGRNSLELLADVQYAFGIPFHPAYEGQFTLMEKSLSLKIMQYFSNFIRSGNPNYPYEFSRKAPEFATLWPDFIPYASGESYKEFSALLPNRQGLKKADCSFWFKYIQSLKASADEATSEPTAESEKKNQTAGFDQGEDLLEQEPKSYSK